MKFDELVLLIREHGAAMIASALLVAPVVWLILHFLYRERLEKLKDDIASLERRLKQQGDTRVATTELHAASLETTQRNFSTPNSPPPSPTDDPPIFRLRSDGFMNGDDAALETVIAALRFAKKSEGDCFRLVLPEADQNVSRIDQLKAISDRNEAEKEELVMRLGREQANEKALTQLQVAFKIILQHQVFRESYSLHESAECTWEVLVGLRTQVFRQLAFDSRTHLYLSTTATERIRGDVLLTNEEFESEDTRYLNDGNSRPGILHGAMYGLEWFTPATVRRRCLASIALMLAASKTQSLPEAAYDIRTWRLSIDPMQSAG